VLEADEGVTIFFRAGVPPNNEIPVGLQERAVKSLRELRSSWTKLDGSLSSFVPLWPILYPIQMTTKEVGRRIGRETVHIYVYLPSCPRFRHGSLILSSPIFPGRYASVDREERIRAVHSNTTPKIGMRSRTEGIWMCYMARPILIAYGAMQNGLVQRLAVSV
jgi:hypothetical protein